MFYSNSQVNKELIGIVLRILCRQTFTKELTKCSSFLMWSRKLLVPTAFVGDHYSMARALHFLRLFRAYATSRHLG